MFRFSLAALLLFVLFAAIGCAALNSGGELWRQTVVSGSVAMLLTATLAAVVWRGERRLAATGFSVFGWAYLLLAFVSALGLRSDLLTEKSLGSLYTVMHGENPMPDGWTRKVVHYSPQGDPIAQYSDPTVRVWDAAGQSFRAGDLLLSVPGTTPTYEDFADIGHALWVLLIACLGAVIARALRNRRELNERSSSSL